MAPRLIQPATMTRLLRARDRLQDAPADAPALIELASDIGLSRAHFLRSFAHAFGVTPHDYLTEVRLDRAKRALARGASVTEACFDVGFSSLGSFSRLFARRVGLPPRDWQRRVRTVLPSAELWPAVWIPGCFLARYTPSTFGEAMYGGCWQGAAQEAKR
jgi:AraC-like DNA-binding protein